MSDPIDIGRLRGDAADAPRYGAAIAVRPRLGQGRCSLAVRDAYGHACAITGEHSDPLLAAAHIMPYGHGGQHRVDKGCCCAAACAASATAAT